MATQAQAQMFDAAGLNSTPGSNVRSWTLTSAGNKGYAATISTTKTIYDMALLTYLIAFGHFTSEICFFRTAKINLPVLSPVIVSTASLIWMLKQYDFYVAP
ncbi:hypothetical protein BDR07DRAFT_1467438 [Suillus spraguei]|nr:hypothetical protein BDR07DRAFT_1467438 [Suillus spraguei]